MILLLYNWQSKCKKFFGNYQGFDFRYHNNKYSIICKNGKCGGIYQNSLTRWIPWTGFKQIDFQ